MPSVRLGWGAYNGPADHLVGGFFLFFHFLPLKHTRKTPKIQKGPIFYESDIGKIGNLSIWRRMGREHLYTYVKRKGRLLSRWSISPEITNSLCWIFANPNDPTNANTRLVTSKAII